MASTQDAPARDEEAQGQPPSHSQEPLSTGRDSTMMDVKWLSNHHVLGTAAVLFACFVAAEIIGALAGNSLSLLGDAAAMSVDVFTYFCNMYAERVKEKNGGAISVNTRMWLEVFIPLFSVTALVGVTIYITVDAVQRIMDPEDEDVNVAFLFGFAAGNAVVDCICSGLFWLKRDTVFSEAATETDSMDQALINSTPSGEAAPPKRLNLNMASAFTHVGGDTMRTLAVFLAALIATVTSINGTLTDAWSAIFVSITIVFLVIPLLQQIFKVYFRLRAESKDAA